MGLDFEDTVTVQIGSNTLVGGVIFLDNVHSKLANRAYYYLLETEGLYMKAILVSITLAAHCEIITC